MKIQIFSSGQTEQVYFATYFLRDQNEDAGPKLPGMAEKFGRLISLATHIISSNRSRIYTKYKQKMCLDGIQSMKSGERETTFKRFALSNK